MRSAGAVAVLVATLPGAALIGAALPAAALAKGLPGIQVVSARPELVAGGQAVVAITAPKGVKRSKIRVFLGRKRLRHVFAIRLDGRYEGLVTGLKLGKNVLSAVLPNGRGARITITNHRIGGPVFSGPQIQPWQCQPGARDAQCNQAPTYRYVYMSTDQNKSGFQPYDPAKPPSDVAYTTTDQGVTVPFIVRVEIGYEDRDQYAIATLFDPKKPWSWAKPQRQWNHKLLITHGASCGVDHAARTAPSVTDYNPANVLGLPNSQALQFGDGAHYALGHGFAVMSTALDNSGHNCNVAVQAESLVVAKQHLIDTYGTVRYTIGTGCSGGSLAQQWIANAYPGIYQGILPTCSFPDAWTSAVQVADYALIEHYYLALSSDPTRVVTFLPNQLAAIEGNALPLDALVSVGCTNPNPPYTPSSCPSGYFYAAVPYWPCKGVPSAQLYNAQSNPGGVRCSVTELNKNLLGPRGPAVWSAAEKRIGHGFTGLPIDNVGVQYGLDALRTGQITAAQFVDLNAHIGGSDIDVNPVPNRLVADRPALANAYRTGLINETNNLNQTAIIDCRGPDPGAAHDSYRAFALRARLDREHGNHANQLIWEGSTPIVGDTECNVNSLIAMDRWMAAVERDHSNRSVARKVVSDKPTDLQDECWSGNGTKISNGLCGQAVVPVYGTPRTVAGDPITTDANKCQLKPLRRSDYDVTFTDAQWATLQSVYPTGVCDFSKPGVDQGPTVPWQTYQDARGRVIYGGRPLGSPPRGKPCRLRRRGSPACR